MNTSGKSGGNNPGGQVRDAVRETAAGAVDTAGNTATGALDAVKGKVDETVKQGKAMASNVGAAAGEAVDAASHAYDTARAAAVDVVERGRAVASDSVSIVAWLESARSTA